ncbi:MAG: hypothetical protein CNLJKLNK_00725 [Holosporales bacterium]
MLNMKVYLFFLLMSQTFLDATQSHSSAQASDEIILERKLDNETEQLLKRSDNENFITILNEVIQVKGETCQDFLFNYLNKKLKDQSPFFNHLLNLITRCGMLDLRIVDSIISTLDFDRLKMTFEDDSIVDFINVSNQDYKEMIQNIHNFFKIISSHDLNIKDFFNVTINCFKNLKRDLRPEKRLFEGFLYLCSRNILNDEDFQSKLSSELNCEETIADCFSLVTVQKDKAFCEAKGFLSTIDQHLNPDVIKSRIDENFKQGYLRDLSDLYEANNWQGNRNFFKKSELLYTYTQTETRKAVLDTKYQQKKYEYYPADGDLETIIVSLYGGDTSYSFSEKTIHPPFEKGMMTATIELGDRDSLIFQSNQLRKENFMDTHSRYLRVAGEFIKFLKETYPQAKILLKGSSFGGFFVTSYAYLSQMQNQEDGENLYTDYIDWAREAFETEYKDHFKLPAVDGIILNNGSIDFFEKIVNSPHALSKLKIPILMHQNFDDERSPLSEKKESLKKINPKFLRFILSRSGSHAMMGETTNEECENNFKRNHCILTLRGHYNNFISLDKFYAEILHFIDMIKQNKFGENRSEFDIEQTKRRIKLTLQEMCQDDISSVWFTKKDIQQFLSNRREIQEEAEKIAITNKGRLSEEDILRKSLYNILIPEHMTAIQCYEDLKNYTSIKSMIPGLYKLLKKPKSI